jgi:hypothetical protein
MVSRSAPRWIVVVSPDRPDVYTAFGRSYQGSPDVEVLIDRRRGDRRQGNRPPDSERRLTDRRSAGRDPSQTPTHRLASRGDGFAVYEQIGPVTAACAACGLEVYFEIPRFAEPPVRLTFTVLHETIRPKHAAHVVDFQTFSPTGRPLVASRLQARVPSESSEA